MLLFPWEEAGRQTSGYWRCKQEGHSRRLKGEISHTPDAFDPLTDQELKDLGFE